MCRRTIRIRLCHTFLESLSGFKTTELILIPCPTIPYGAGTVSRENIDHTFERCTSIYVTVSNCTLK